MQPKDKSSQEDVQLITAVAAGDTGAFGKLYDRHSSKLLGVAIAILKHRREAEDLLHDVFMELWQKAGTYDASKGPVSYWLLLRIRSRAIDRQRKTRNKLQFEQQAILQTEDLLTSDDTLDYYELTEAIDNLSSPQRDVIILNYIQGYSCSEISRLIDVPVGTIKSRLRSALKIMQTRFEHSSGASA